MNYLWTLLFLWTIQGHAPIYQVSSVGSCDVDSTKSAQVYAVILYRFGQQAPSWFPGSERDTITWNPVIREAAPIQIMSVACTDGQYFQFTISDTSRQYAYFVKPRDSQFLESTCWGRVIKRP